ncbi:hypothetical protein QBC42DRAFT_285944 [Cladorrhinum samala]|uniref:Uncharacterized protein n=1 Tax=Cladorrhinum samala TaxID=585594 RepID=A0AAV9HS93_9PEZI|nr:hypothetical protein QBC42DRAFT_285944 [Cladorrhinum samala]
MDLLEPSSSSTRLERSRLATTSQLDLGSRRRRRRPATTPESSSSPAIIITTTTTRSPNLALLHSPTSISRAIPFSPLVPVPFPVSIPTGATAAAATSSATSTPPGSPSQSFQRTNHARSRSRTRPPPPPPTLSTSPMTPKTFRALLLNIHSALSHTRYAVAGLAALIVFGYGSECTMMPSRVTVLTGSDSAEALRSWAVTVGEWWVFRRDGDGGGGGDDDDDVIGVPVRVQRGGEGRFETEWRGLTVKTLGEDEVGSLEIVKVKEIGGVRVVGLRGMLELRAGAWLGMVKKMDSSSSLKARRGGEDGNNNNKTLEDERRGNNGMEREMMMMKVMIEQCERQVRWILKRLKLLAAQGKRVKMHPSGMKNFFSKDFWDGFLMREPRAKEMLEALGVERKEKEEEEEEEEEKEEEKEVGGLTLRNGREGNNGQSRLYTTVEGSRHYKREKERYAPDSFRKRVTSRDPNPSS